MNIRKENRIRKSARFFGTFSVIKTSEKYLDRYRRKVFQLYRTKGDLQMKDTLYLLNYFYFVKSHQEGNAHHNHIDQIKQSLRYCVT